MRTKSVRTHEYNSEEQKAVKLKKPIVTYNVSVSNADAYDLGELDDMKSYAHER